MGSCTLCGRPPEQADPLVPDEFYDDVAIHLHCLNGEPGLEWRRARAAADPAYARYLALTTMGLEQHCPACDTPQVLSPKAAGMGAGHWELCCDTCAACRPLLNGYRPGERELVMELSRRAFTFRKGRDPEVELRAVAKLDVPETVPRAQLACECGGTFRIDALPRCTSCRAVVLESPFHFTLRAAPRRAAEEMQMGTGRQPPAAEAGR